MKLSEILRERGYVHQHSSETLEEITDGPKRTVYLGVDPTADSIHVGNLAAYMLLRRFAEAGHTIILLIGGGTGLIGDPKPDVERPLVDPSELQARSKNLTQQAEHLLGGVSVTVVNNADWLTKLNLIDFLRDVGKHFTVNALVKKDAISARFESEEGISFTEFSYPLLQAYDFWHLNAEYGCDVQIGGSDQWGNIVAGVDLIHRKANKTAYGLTLPLIVDKATGKKFGKSEGNAIWLDPKKTSPYAFYQFWLNASDESVIEYLKLFTFLSDEEIAGIAEEHAREKGARGAQKKLAYEVTKQVHDETAASNVRSVSEVLFGEKTLSDVSEEARHLLREEAPKAGVQLGVSIIDALIISGLASSRREARQFIADGAVSLNGGTVQDVSKVLEEGDFKNNLALLKRGKRNVSVLILA